MTQQLREALRLAVDHIDMDALAISHCKDHAAITAALSQPEPVQAVTPTSGNILVDAFNEVQALKQQAAAALSQPEPVGERDLLRRILANHDGAMGLIGERMRSAGLTSMTIPEEEGVYFSQQYALMEEARAILARTSAPAAEQPMSPKSVSGTSVAEQDDKCPTCGSDCNERDELIKAEREIERLRAAAEQAEPVGFLWRGKGQRSPSMWRFCADVSQAKDADVLAHTEIQLVYTNAQPAREPMTLEQRRTLVGNYFADAWARRAAFLLLADYDKHHGIASQAKEGGGDE